MRLLLAVLAAIAPSDCMAFVPGQGAFERTIKVSGPVELDVVSEVGGVILTVGTSDMVRVNATLTPQYGPLDLASASAKIRTLEANPPIEQTGNRIRIGYPSDPQLLARISMRLEIEAPQNTVIRARTSSGGIRVNGVNGPVDGQSNSGRIEIGDIAGDVRATTQSGGIFIRNARGRVVVQNGSGGIQATEIAGAIEAKNGSGAIRLSQTEPASIHARAGSGAIKVTLAPGAGYALLAHSKNGKISTPDLNGQKEKNPRHLSTQIDGGGPLIDLGTDSSSISIER